MIKRVLAFLFLLAGLSIAPGWMAAHHAEENFDHENLWVFKGTATRLDFVNPHVIVRFDVTTREGEVEQWVGTESSPNAMRRYGWSQNTVKPGDKIVITGFRHKEDRKIFQIAIIDVNGKHFESSTTAVRQLNEYKKRHPNKETHAYN